MAGIRFKLFTLNDKAGNVLSYNTSLLSYLDKISGDAINTYILLREIATRIKRAKEIELSSFSGFKFTSLVELSEAELIDLSNSNKTFNIRIKRVEPIESEVYEKFPQIAEFIPQKVDHQKFKRIIAVVSDIYRTFLKRHITQKELMREVYLLKRFIEEGHSFDDINKIINFMIVNKQKFENVSNIRYHSYCLKE